MKKITMQLGELITIVDSLKKISEATETSMSFRWEYSGFITEVDENLNRFSELRKALLEEFKVEEGSVITEEHAKKFNDLLLEEVKFGFGLMPRKEIEKIESLTMEDISVIKKFVTQD